jgi:hypothetical protein
VDWIKALKTIAFKEALSKEPSYEFQERRICRWYSKTFATPLDQVYDLPVYDVFQAYYEEHYDSLVDGEDPLAINKELHSLSMTDKELAEEKLTKDREEADIFSLQKSCMKDTLEVDSKQVFEKNKRLKEKLLRDLQAARELEVLMSKDSLGTKPEVINSPTGYKGEPKPPAEVKMTFTDIEDIGDLDGISLPPDKF